MQVKDLRGKTHYLKIKPIIWEKPSCSDLQKSCKDMLHLHWDGDVVGEEVMIPGSRLRCDFLNLSKKILLEIMGKQHASFVPFFHKKNIHNLIRSIERDTDKEKWATLNGFQYFAVKNTTDLAKVLVELDK